MVFCRFMFELSYRQSLLLDTTHSQYIEILCSQDCTDILALKYEKLIYRYIYNKNSMVLSNQTVHIVNNIMLALMHLHLSLDSIRALVHLNSSVRVKRSQSTV
jgi:hypothetical protein